MLQSGHEQTGAVNKAMKEMILSAGSCGFSGSIHGIYHNGGPAAFCGLGVNRIQVDALGLELFEVLRQRTGLIGQVVLLGRSFLVGNARGIQSLLG